MNKKRRLTVKEKIEICEIICMATLWLMIISAMCAWVFGAAVYPIVKPLAVVSLGVFLCAAWKGGVFHR